METFIDRADARIYFVRLFLSREGHEVALLIEVTDAVVDSPAMRKAAREDGLDREQTFEQVAVATCFGELDRRGRLVSQDDEATECRRVLADEATLLAAKLNTGRPALVS